MSYTETVEAIKEDVAGFLTELEKAETNKAAGARARKFTLKLAKEFKEFRKLSVEQAKK